MSPTDIFDIKTIIETYGLVTFLFVCGSIVAGWIAFRRVKSIIIKELEIRKKIVDFTDQEIQLLKEKREILKRFDSVFMQHVEDTERFASEEHWKSCQIDKCPYLHKFFEELKDQNQLITQFYESIKSLCENTKESNGIMMRRLDDFSTAVMTWYRKNGNG